MKNIILLLLLSLAAPCGARELSLDDALAAAERSSPLLKAGDLHERAAREKVGQARAYYFPVIDADGIDSWGFPGSIGYLGEGGVASSPYRKGLAGDVVARQTLFDFGRAQAKVREAKTAVL